jgi:hypothetical protein
MERKNWKNLHHIVLETCWEDDFSSAEGGEPCGEEGTLTARREKTNPVKRKNTEGKEVENETCNEGDGDNDEKTG